MLRFLDKIISLDNIHQWEERDSIIKESVSQHSFKVACIAIYLLNKMSCNDVWFIANVVAYANLHDFDEAILKRDIAHPVKYNKKNGDELRRIINEYVDYQLEKDELKFTKDFDDDVKLFVKVCDWIALLTFICRNEKLGCDAFSEEEKYCVVSFVNSLQKLDKIQNLFDNFSYIKQLKKQIEEYGR